MSAKDTSKESEGPSPAVIFATDMTEDTRQTIIGVAQRAFHAPVNQGKVYQTIADLIRTECEKECDAAVGGGDGSKGGGDASGGAGSGMAGKSIGSGGWSCVVGDAFGSSVTHRLKSYIHFSVVPGVNVLLWKS